MWALPLSLGWLLSVRPPRATPDYVIWASRMMQSGFVLRLGMVYRIRVGNLTTWSPRFILT